MDKLNVLSYYLEQNKNSEWYKRFYKNEEGYDGTVFKFLGTNYRHILYFKYYFNKFKPYIGIPRNEWEKKETTGQEVAKQYVVNLVSTFLYTSSRDQNGQLIYTLTEKGKVFERMISSNFTEEEEKLLILLMILNGSFNKTPRYILKKSKEVIGKLQSYNVNIDKLMGNVEKFIIYQKSSPPVKTMFSFESIWLLTFYTDKVFIKLFNLADEELKKKLFLITQQAYDNKDTMNVLSWKYKGTNNQRYTTIDNYILLFLNHSIEKIIENCLGFDSFYNFIIDSYSTLYNIDKDKIHKFIEDNKNVFIVIYKSIISNEDDFTEVYISPYKNPSSIDIPKEKIDDTSEDNVEKLKTVREVLKRLAKEKSHYECALKNLNDCKYFTSREEENKNYLEIHHFIPREYSYEFEETIEFVENYVPLCPRCHRMIHNAADRERIVLINYLYKQRNEDFIKNNINVDLKTMYEFYKLDEK